MNRRALPFLGAALLGLVAAPAFAPAASAADSFTPSQKDELRKVVHDYLLEHPEVVMDAINELQAKEDQAKTDKQAAGVKQHKKDLFEVTDGTVLGNPKGDVAMVEFFDYNCGYCKGMFPAMMDTLKKDGKVKLILKEFPILGPSSVTATKAALAARKQDKYSQLHLALMSHKGGLTDDAVMQIAKDTGLDMDKLKKDMADPAVAAIIEKNRTLAEDLNIEGTPALVIGDKLVPGAVAQDQLVALIKDARH